jgi:5-methyltetrahydropteroyltriglutamate--homocysteine methyltransferase
VTTAYRADHVGSLLRPSELLDARAAYAKGELDLAQLRAAEDRAIDQAIEVQRAAGVDVFTDGELRRGSWLTDMAEAVEGFERDSIQLEWHGPGGGLEPSTSHIVGGRLRPTRHLTEHELPYLVRRRPGPLKVTVPSASVFLFASYRAGVTDRVYPTRADLARDVVPIIRAEIAWLLEHGVGYVQLDNPFYTNWVDPHVRERMRAGGVDPDEMLALALQADNDSLAGLDRSAAVIGLHVCRGNSRSRWYAEGSYEPIAEKVFGLLDVDRFLLEYDTDRAGGFEPLRFVPKGKTVVLGLVSTKVPELEPQDQLLRRIEEASKYVPPEDLALSPQCGFASVAAGNLLGPDDQRRKLELVAEVARAVWS